MEDTIDISDMSDHETILDGFVHTLNAVRPQHSYIQHAMLYPAEPHNVQYSYKKSDSSYYASCGPRDNVGTPFFFAADKEYFSSCEPERILAIYLHELTHLYVGSHSDEQSGAHPPRFWRELGFNAHKALDSWEQLESKFGDLSKSDFIGYIVNGEVNSFNIDRRYRTVTEARQEMARWFESTLK